MPILTLCSPWNHYCKCNNVKATMGELKIETIKCLLLREHKLLPWRIWKSSQRQRRKITETEREIGEEGIVSMFEVAAQIESCQEVVN